jgi:hypothetical protein
MRQPCKLLLRGWFVVFALAMASLTGALELTQAMNMGKPEVDGLRAAVSDVSWDGGTLTIGYTLHWTGGPFAWRLDREVPVNVSFWDSITEPAHRVSVEIDFVALPKAFLARTSDSTAAVVHARGVPPGAAAVSLALGTSGLETDRIALPKR